MGPEEKPQPTKTSDPTTDEPKTQTPEVRGIVSKLLFWEKPQPTVTSDSKTDEPQTQTPDEKPQPTETSDPKTDEPHTQTPDEKPQPTVTSDPTTEKDEIAEAEWKHKWYAVEIKAVNADGSYHIVWIDEQKQTRRFKGRLRKPLSHMIFGPTTDDPQTKSGSPHRQNMDDKSATASQIPMSQIICCSTKPSESPICIISWWPCGPWIDIPENNRCFDDEECQYCLYDTPGDL